MPLEELLQWIRRQPFEPFRIHLTDGTSYEVRHPELIMAGARAVHVGIAINPNQLYYDRAEVVSLIHVVRIEPMPSPASANTNGQAK